MEKIEITKINDNFIEKIGKEWFLISAFKANTANAMTCSWGTLGFVWNTPVFMAMVRDSRYTKEFMDANDNFSVSFFQSTDREMLTYFGKISGRNEDKFAKYNMKPQCVDGAPLFENASLTIVCRKLLCTRLSEDKFIDQSMLDKFYKNKDMHSLYAGEVVSVYRA